MSSNNDIESILQREGFYLFAGNGDSMWPMLHGGSDIVDIRPCNRAGLKKGQVVLYRSKGIYVLHRILQVHDEYCVTRGDNCIMTENIPCSDIIGIMNGFWRGKRKISASAPGCRIYSYIIVNCPRLAGYLKTLLKKI